MRTFARIAIPALVGVLLAGCAPSYSLVKPAPVHVGGRSFEVQPSIAWNRVPRTPGDIPEQERWTQNGLILDSIGFIGGLKDGKAIAKQRAKDAQQVPVFRASMTPQDLVSMLESYYRIQGGVTVFQTISVQPVKFVGANGLQLDYEFIVEDQVKRRGRAVMAIADEKLYVMNLNAAAVHYFDAALPEFQSMAASARIGGGEG